MDVIFASPLGFLALLGVPAVLLLHMLEVEPPAHEVSTLFLFEHVAVESDTGRRLNRLTTSAAMWLQILAVLLTTWLLVEPRFLVEDRRQRIVIVLDASASMSAFRAEAARALAARTEALREAAPSTEWVLLESTGREGRLYRGEDRSALLAAAGSFSPRAGAHDDADTLRLARQLGADAVLFVTDHVVEAPAGVAVLAVGRPTTNVGFSGLTAGDAGWSTLVQNHGDEAVERAWWIEEDAAGPRSPLRLGPRELRVLKGPFPDGVTELTLRLDGDAFSLDDTLAIVRPQEKRLRVTASERVGHMKMVSRLLAALPRVEQVESGAELVVTARRWDEPIDPARASVVFLDAPSETVRRSATGAFDVGHVLADALEWRGLSYRPDKSFVPRDGDAPVLVDDEGRALVFSRGRALVVGFDVRRSNAAVWPSFLILLARHIEATRSRVVGFERRNVEAGQLASLATPPGATVFLEREGKREVVGSGESPVPWRAPLDPGPFELVDADGEALGRFAARFADVREADLSAAGAADGTLDVADVLARRARGEDPRSLLWALGLLGAMLASFYFARGRGA